MFYIVRGRSNIPYQLENLINETKKGLPLKREVSL
ncbi:hypothetical protein IGK20_001584 [Enterococcus sp. AZ112]